MLDTTKKIFEIIQIFVTTASLIIGIYIAGFGKGKEVLSSISEVNKTENYNQKLITKKISVDLVVSKLKILDELETQIKQGQIELSKQEAKTYPHYTDTSVQRVKTLIDSNNAEKLKTLTELKLLMQNLVSE